MTRVKRFENPWHMQESERPTQEGVIEEFKYASDPRHRYRILFADIGKLVEQ